MWARWHRSQRGSHWSPMTHVGTQTSLLGPLPGHLSVRSPLGQAEPMGRLAALRKWEEEVEERLGLGCRRQEFVAGVLGTATRQACFSRLLVLLNLCSTDLT